MNPGNWRTACASSARTQSRSPRIFPKRNTITALLHVASLTFFDFHIHQEQRGTSMEGFDFREFFARLQTNEKRGFSKDEILAVLRDEGERWCDWVERLPVARAAEIVTRGAAGGKSRFEMLIGTKEHEMHHRAQ